MARFMRTDLGGGHSRLRPPTVVAVQAAPEIFFGPKRELVATGIQTARENVLRRSGHSKLSPPVVVGPVLARPPVVSLAPQSRRPGSGLLRPPVVVAPVLARPTLVSLAPQSVRPGRAVIRPPVVVGPILAKPTAISLAPSSRGTPRSRLQPPTVVFPFFARQTVISLAPSSRGAPRSRLQPPAVVGAFVPFFARPIETSLALSSRGKAQFRLSGPVVITVYPFVPYPITVTLAPPGRAKTSSRLRPPQVVAVAADYSTRKIFSLARVGRDRQRTQFALRGPVVVTAAVVFVPRPIAVSLAPSSVGRTQFRLQGPVVITVTPAEAARPISVALTSQRPPRAQFALRGPVVITVLVPRLGAVNTQLAPTIRLGRRAGYRLAPPAIVDVVLEAFYGPRVDLTRIRPRKVQSRLSAPRVVTPRAPFVRGLIPALAPQQRGETMSRLRAPAVVTAAPLPSPAKVRVSLAPQSRRPGSTQLRPPAVVGAGITFLGVDQIYAPSLAIRVVTSRAPLSKLYPPTAVATPAEPVAFAIRLTLAPSQSRRGQAILNPPTVVGAGRFFAGVTQSFAPSSRLARATRWFLREPIVAPAPRAFAPIQTSLAPSQRRRGQATLNPPAVVGRAGFRPALVSLAPSIRKPGRADLKSPAVVGAGIVFPGIKKTYAPGGPKPVHRRRRTLLRPPVVVQVFRAQRTRVELAPSTRGRARYGLAPPAVVRPLPLHARPITVTLAPSRYPTRFWQLFPPTVLGERPHGDVCGGDRAESCAIQGGDRVAGDDCVDGTDRISAYTSGGDRKAD